MIIYVTDIDTYVQFDGVYWHGFDRLIEDIVEYKSPRDVIIHRKWNTDRAQDAWFKDAGMHLIRVTDTEFKTMENDVLQKLVRK
jgi:hypothetical protein